MEVDETKQLVVTDYTPTLDSSVETSSSLATWWSARQEDDLSAVVLTAVDLGGLVWLSVALIMTIVFLMVYLCWWWCCLRTSEKDDDDSNGKTYTNGSAAEPRGIADLIKATSHLGARLVDTEGGSPAAAMGALREVDEYSNSSRAHLAQGVEPGPLQYIRVQGVTTEEEEDGVVCGHLTLGPSFAVGDNSSVRTASSNRLKQQTFSKV